MLSMTKGVPEFDSVQNQDTECLSPSFRRPLSLNKGLQDKLENKRALVDRKRKKGFCNVFLAFSFTYPLKVHGRRKQASTEAHVPMHSGLPRRYLIQLIDFEARYAMLWSETVTNRTRVE